MNWDEIKGEWMQLKGAARQKWAELTDDELQDARGDREKLIGLVQEKYGKARSEAEAEVDEWHARLKNAA